QGCGAEGEGGGGGDMEAGGTVAGQDEGRRGAEAEHADEAREGRDARLARAPEQAQAHDHRRGEDRHGAQDRRDHAPPAPAGRSGPPLRPAALGYPILRDRGGGMRAPRGVGLGLCVVDHLYLVESLDLAAGRLRYVERRVASGGMTATALAQAAALGCEAHLLSAVGDDPEGRWLRGELRRLGVRVGRLALSRALPTTFAVCLVDPPSREPRFALPDPPPAEPSP